MQEQLSILRPYIRGLPLILLAMAAGFLAARKYLSYTTPMYEATTKIKLADLENGVTGNNLFKDLDVFASTGKIAMEIEVIKSQMLIRRALAGLAFDEELSRIGKVMNKELYRDKPFFHQLTVHDAEFYDRDWAIQVHDSVRYTVTLPGTEECIPGTFGDTLHLRSAASLFLEKNTALLAERPELPLVGPYRLHKYSTIQLVEKVLGNLDVVSVDKDVAVVRIIFRSNVPEKAAAFTDILARTYIDDYIDDKFRTADITAGFLDEQIAEVYRELSAAEMKIQGYRERNDVINIRQETETDLRKISQMKVQQTNARMSLDAIEKLDTYIQQGKENFLELAPNFEAFTDLLSTEMVKKIKELQAERADLLLDYQPGHELVRAVDEKISYYTDYFVESIANTRRNLETKYENLSRDIEEAEKVFIGLPERERVLTILERNFQIQQQSYIFLNEKRIEAGIARAATHAFHRIIQQAAVPHRPVSPNRAIITIVSCLLGMFAAIFLIFVVNASKARVNDVSSIEQNTDIPVLYTAPHLESAEATRTFFKDEVFKLDMKGLLPLHASLVFSAFANNHGVRFHLRHLAETFTREDRNYCLLTFDEDHDYQLPPGRIVVMTEEELSRLTFAGLRQWYRELCARYDLLLVDNFNLSDKPKSLLFIGLADLNLCVMDTRKTRLRSVTELNLLRTKHQMQQLHLVINNDRYSPSLWYEGVWGIRKAATWIKRKV